MFLHLCSLSFTCCSDSGVGAASPSFCPAPLAFPSLLSSVSWVSSPLRLCLKSQANVMPTSYSISVLLSMILPADHSHGNIPISHHNDHISVLRTSMCRRLLKGNRRSQIEIKNMSATHCSLIFSSFILRQTRDKRSRDCWWRLLFVVHVWISSIKY